MSHKQKNIKKFTKEEIDEFIKNSKLMIYIGDIDDSVEKEEFRQVVIKSVNTSYLISSYGRLVNTTYHGIPGCVKDVRLAYDKDGYNVHSICIEGKTKTYKIHRLVANAFIPKVKGKNLINHKNGVKDDNRVENLEWCTNKENIIHAYKKGLKKIYQGEDIYCAKYNNAIIEDICSMLLANKSYDEIRNKYDVKTHTINQLLHKKRWKHISSKYNFDEYIFGKNLKLIKQICEELERGELRPADIARKLHCKDKLVYAILCGHSYRKISKHYDFSKVLKLMNK